MALGVAATGAGIRPGWFARSPRLGALTQRLRRLGVLEQVAIGALVAVTLLLLAVPLIAPHGASDVVADPLRAPSWRFPLGVDEQGRDVLSRVLLGMRTSWFACFAVIGSGIAIGGAVGVVAGLSRPLVDNSLMRLTDVFLALPGPLLVLAVVAALGPSLLHTLVAVGVVWWPFYARIVRGEVKAIAARPHVESARMSGARGWSLARRHVAPGALGPVLVTASLDISALLLTLAGLSFLGLGSPAPAPELGAMAARGFTYIFTAWWVPVFPAAGVFVLGFVGNLAGDAIRDMVEG